MIYDDPEDAKDSAFATIASAIHNMNYLASHDEMPMSLRLEARQRLQDLRKMRENLPRHFLRNPQGD